MKLLLGRLEEMQLRITLLGEHRSHFNAIVRVATLGRTGVP